MFHLAWVYFPKPPLILLHQKLDQSVQIQKKVKTFLTFVLLFNFCSIK